MNEDEYKAYLMDHFGKDFKVREEVEGRFLVDGTKVIIDYLMYSKQHLLKNGFQPDLFAIRLIK